MENKYFETLRKLLKQASPTLGTTGQLEFKRVFGAVAGYVNGRIFISCGRFGVALRLPPDTLSDLLKEEGVAHLKYFPKGRIKKEYAVLPGRIIEERRLLRKLLGQSVEYASSS
jgi:TfoX/Sxy family transcriptional regulator of competence genes